MFVSSYWCQNCYIGARHNSLVPDINVSGVQKKTSFCFFRCDALAIMYGRVIQCQSSHTGVRDKSQKTYSHEHMAVCGNSSLVSF